jgi:hypothetical protein
MCDRNLSPTIHRFRTLGFPTPSAQVLVLGMAEKPIPEMLKSRSQLSPPKLRLPGSLRFATSGFSSPKVWIPCLQDFRNPDTRYAEKPVTLFRGPTPFLQRFRVIAFRDFATPVARPLLLRVPGTLSTEIVLSRIFPDALIAATCPPTWTVMITSGFRNL